MERGEGTGMVVPMRKSSVGALSARGAERFFLMFNRQTFLPLLPHNLCEVTVRFVSHCPLSLHPNFYQQLAFLAQIEQLHLEGNQTTQKKTRQTNSAQTMGEINQDQDAYK